ncbi:MAG: ABC transporter substrate-binding protein, partial [Acidimicrobiia bacterium]|nr:ABC transporter substrate-binding protein [Acidimicrobiia bacterium]
MKKSPLLRLLAALATFAMLAAACGGSDSADEETTDTTEAVEATDEDAAAADEEADAADEEADSSGDRVSTYIGQPESLTPINNTESEGSAVIAALFDTLIDYDRDTNEPVMTNAESITTDDNQTYVVTLKDGYTFHDGTPVTAQSYVDTWNYAAYAPNAQSTAGFFAPIDGYAD